LADKGGAAQISTAMRVLAQIIASDVSLLVTFNHAIDGVLQNNPEARVNPNLIELIITAAGREIDGRADCLASCFLDDRFAPNENLRCCGSDSRTSYSSSQIRFFLEKKFLLEAVLIKKRSTLCTSDSNHFPSISLLGP